MNVIVCLLCLLYYDCYIVTVIYECYSMLIMIIILWLLYYDCYKYVDHYIVIILTVMIVLWVFYLTLTSCFEKNSVRGRRWRRPQHSHSWNFSFEGGKNMYFLIKSSGSYMRHSLNMKTLYSYWMSFTVTVNYSWFLSTWTWIWNVTWIPLLRMVYRLDTSRFVCWYVIYLNDSTFIHSLNVYIYIYSCLLRSYTVCSFSNKLEFHANWIFIERVNDGWHVLLQYCGSCLLRVT
jgi:hypothetical protein